MPSLGTELRLRRFEGPRRRLFLLALDHGLPAGPLPGLEDPRALLLNLRGFSLTGLVANPGMVHHLASDAVSLPRLIVHLSGGTLLGAHPASKVLICSVERALALGADAVSVQIGFGDPNEERMLADAGAVVDEADRFGLPVLIMAYPSGAASGVARLDEVRHAARAAAEVGANLVQVPHPGSAAEVHAVVRGCPTPLVVAGGPRSASAEMFLDAVGAAVAGGAAGIAVGRNLFQHPTPAVFAKRISEVLFADAPEIEVTRT